MSQIERTGTTLERQRRMTGDDFWVLIGSTLSEIVIYKNNDYGDDFEPQRILTPNKEEPKIAGFEDWVYGAPLIARNITGLLIENSETAIYDKEDLIRICSDFRFNRELRHKSYKIPKMEVIKLRGRVTIILNDLLSCQLLHAIGLEVN